MKLRFSVLAIIASLSVLALTTAASAAQVQQGPTTSALTTTLTGTATDAAGTVVGTVSSVLTITGFANQNGQLVANGSLVSTITNTITGATQTVTQAISAPVAAAGSCPILHLTLGPLDLNLLGLQVHLDQVVLDITAQSGPGNLLGNLLCAVAHLLDNPAAPAGGLAALLNNLLANL
ncbi:MAG: hypothetical protein QOH16_473 [Gaiellaceae bacterium]|jgi:hypothetical protein|nr:hypothetical protein [Gaiellaceae bacterium]